MTIYFYPKDKFNFELLIFPSKLKFNILVLLQSFPRKIWLDKGGKQLVQWPVEEIEMLRTNKVDLQNITLEAGLKREICGVTAAQV